MKTFTKHILLLALMLFGVAGAAWADRAPQKFTGPVAKTDLVEGDTLAPGFSITGLSVSNNLGFDPNRYKQDGVLGNGNSITNGNTVTGYGGDNPVAIIISETILYTPVDESGQDGNAWVVTYNSGSYVFLSGIYIAPDPTVPALDELTGNWNFLMPGSNKVVKVTYKAEPALAWTFGGRAIPNDTTITAYRGFELPVIGSIGAIMNHDFYTALQGGTVSLRYGSTNPAVISFTNPNNMYSFSVNGAGECDVYMVFDGNDDFQDDSVAFHAVIANPATLTLAKEGNGTVSALLGGGSATWTTETWANLPTDQNLSPLTFGDITISTTGSLTKNSSYNPGKLSFFVSQFDDAKTLTFSSEGGNFSRIEMTMVSEYSQYNPSIIPADGWTFDGYTAVWEGDAPSVTVTSCSTYVSQITFTRGIDSIVATATEGQYLVIPGATVQVVATAQDGNHVQGWNEIDKVVTNLLSDTATIVVNQSQTLTATFAQNPLLTLAVNDANMGTVKIAESVGTLYNITFDNASSQEGIRTITIPASRMPYDTTFSYNANIDFAEAYDQMHESVSIIARGDNWVTVRISGAFEYGGYYECELEGGDRDDWSISCKDSIGLVPPDGITKTGDNTYRVLPGTEVNVTATPDSAHYLSRIDGHDTVSNYACGYSFVMPSGDYPLMADFQAKPTLTLTQTNGGTLEAIVPQGGVTAMHPTTDQIPTWDGNTEYAMAADLQQFGFVAVDSAAAAAWTGVPASGDIILVYALAGNQFKAILFQDGQWHGTYTSNFYKGEIYSYTYSDIIYFTTGVSKSNVIASSTPNTYYIDYGTPVTVVATPDAQHYLVSFSDDDPATERNSNIAVEKTYDSVINDIPNLSATFQAKPVLTLAQTDGGTLTVEGAGSAGGEVTIGNGTETTSVTPYNSLWEYSFVESLYTAEEIGTAGTITSVSYHLRENDEPQTSDFVIYMKNVSRSTFASGTDYEPVTDADIVYSGSVTFNPGWTTITLGTPFEYDGTSNLMIAFDENIPGFITRYFYYTDNAGKVVSYHADNYNPDPYNLGSYAGNKTVSSNRANIKLDIAPAATAIVALSDTTYRVDYGTEVTVVATPDSIHYLATLGEELVNSNDSIHRTFTMTAPVNLPADFRAKPTLTLAHNDGGTLELDGVTDPSPATATIEFAGNNNTVTVSNVTLPHTFSCSYSTENGELDQIIKSLYEISSGYNQPAFPPTASGNDNVTAGRSGNNHYITISAPFEGPAAVTGGGYWKTTGEETNFEYNLTITILSSTPGSTGLIDGVVSANATRDTFVVDYGTDVTLNAEATALHHVQGWDNGNGTELTGATYSDYFVTTPQNLFPAKSTVTLTVTGDTTARALFGINSYDVTASVAPTTDERGTVRIASTDVQGAAQVSDSLATVTVTAQGGSTSTLTAYPAWGYHFVEWQNQNGTQVSTQNPLAVTSVVDTALVAVFDTTKAELAWSADEFLGYTFIDFNAFKPTLSNPHNVEVRLGVVEDIDFDAENYVIGEENSYGHTVGATGTYHVYAVHDLSQEYFYDSVVYTLTVEQGVIVNLQKNVETGGMAVFPEYSETGSATLQYLSEKMAVVGYGQTVTIDAAPETGYHFTQWQARTTGAYNYVSDETPYNYAVPMALTVGIQAVFDTNVYNMELVAATDIREVGTDTAMGSVTGPATVKHFHSGTYVATPYYGYRFLNWQNAAGEVVSELDTIEVVPVSDTALTAVFGYDRYAITAVSANAQLGSVEGSDTVDYLEPVSLTATPDYGYRFDNWTNANGDTLGSEPTLEVIALRDSVITANFVTDEFVVTAQSADALMGTATGTATADYMAEVTLKATPETGYHFVNWTEADTLYSVEDSITVVANASRTFTANFDTNVYNVAIAVAESSEGRGTVENTPMEVKHFLNATYTATPEYGYHFAGWMNAADSVVSTGNPLVLSPVSDTALSAVFDTNAYVLTVAVAEGQSHMATTQGSDSAARQFRNYEIGVTPEYGYYFVAWNDGNTENPRTVTLTSDSTFTASFEANTYVLTLAKDENLGYITLEGAGNGENLNLAEVTADTVVADGTTLYGTLGANVKVSIAEGATVTLDGVTINGLSNIQYSWAGITCLGDATIILDGENSVRGFYENYPGIYVPEGSTLTIEGRGSLTVNGSVYGAGIGGGLETACGNIVIAGGTVNATGGSGSAAIGSGNNASCGDITISGGHVTANCGEYAAGIGSGMMGSCGTITIASGVTAIHADKGVNANTIGKGFGGSVAAVIVNGTTGAITTSPYSYEGDGTGWTNDGLPTGVTNNHDGTYTVVYNTEVNVIAKAIEHYHVERWSNEAEVTTLNPDTIAVTVTKDSTIMVYFGYNSIAGDTTAVACNQFTWHGVTYTETPAENPTYVYHLDNGYDSVVTLHLTIVSRYTNHEYVTNCGPYTWEANGRTYNKTGVKTFKHYAEDGCPIYDTLTLTVGYGRTSHKYVENCGPYTWDVNGRTYNLTGVKTFKSYTEEGCPNYDTLTLTVKAAGRISHEYVEHCGPYTWDVNGQTYNQTGVKTFKSYNEAGCPNYDTLTLTVKTAGRTSHEHVEHCGPYTWDVNGRTYNQTGVKTFKSYNEAGCPNYDTLTLTVVSRYTNHEYVEHCGPYTWDVTGKTYNKSGVKTYKHYAEDGCPIYDTLTLTVNNCEPSDNGENFGLGESDALTQMTVYPNPTTGRLQINAAEVNKVEVLDMVGRCVAVFENTLTIDLSNLAASTYTLRVTMPEGVALRKVVKR